MTRLPAPHRQQRPQRGGRWRQQCRQRLTLGTGRRGRAAIGPGAEFRDDYKAWDTAETIEEARDKRSKLAMSFFSRAVVIVASPSTSWSVYRL